MGKTVSTRKIIDFHNCTITFVVDFLVVTIVCAVVRVSSRHNVI